jgi:hypothetical protein
MQEIIICITFDVDFVMHDEGGIPINEFEAVFPSIFSILSKKPHWKSTWFIRLDGQMEALYGKADYVFSRHQEEISELQQHGHEIGWHAHCYVLVDGQWKQNINVTSILNELKKYAPLALSYEMRSVRMGWGFHKNETLGLLSNLGFLVDSSAIPRPAYRWEETIKDWNGTPSLPYFPSKLDYRIPGEPFLSILEVPMSVTHIQSPSDNEQVLRYINLAYHPDVLKEPMELWIAKHSCLITVTHPYELLRRKKNHDLLAFDPDALEQNLLAIDEFAEKKGISVSFRTLSELAGTYVRENECIVQTCKS